MTQLAQLSLRKWCGGANCSQDQSGEWYACGGHTYELRLTDWPLLDGPGLSSFIPEPQESYPLQVKAVLTCSGRYGASVSLKIDSHHVSGIGTHWSGRVTVASAQRRGLAWLYDRQEELVHAALSSYYAGAVHGPRTAVISKEGEHIATFFYSSAAFNCARLPREYFTLTAHGQTGERWVSWCRHEGSTRSGTSGPDIRARLESLIGAERLGSYI